MKIDQLIGYLDFAEKSGAKRRKKRKTKLRFKNENSRYFDAKLRFAQPFLPKLKWETNKSLQGLTEILPLSAG